jgi:hypothetical protein
MELVEKTKEEILAMDEVCRYYVLQKNGKKILLADSGNIRFIETEITNTKISEV